MTAALCAIAIVSFYLLWADVQRTNAHFPDQVCDRAEVEIFFNKTLGHYDSRMVGCANE